MFSPHNAGWVGVSEDPEARWYGIRTIKKAPKASLVILYEGTREECLKKEYQLRPSPRIGWNIARGGMAVEPRKHGRRPIKGDRKHLEQMRVWQSAAREIDTRTLQTFMGHRSISNTVIYTAVADKRIRNIWGKR